MGATANPPKSDDKYRISLTNVWGYLNNVPYYVISFLKKGVLYKGKYGMLKKVFNWSEVHLSEVTSYKIHTLVIIQGKF